jgi:hypothetical protein
MWPKRSSGLTPFSKPLSLQVHLEKKNTIEPCMAWYSHHPVAKPLSLTFLSNGKLVSSFFWYLHPDGMSTNPLDYMVSVKTQFAGPLIHQVLIHLFDYVSKKYFRHFTMLDEGGYWETRDEKKLRENFEYLASLIDGFQTVLETLPAKKGESLQAFIEQAIEKMWQLKPRKK